MTSSLRSLSGYRAPRGPVVLVIMDGVGIGGGDEGDMVAKASTPHLDMLKATAPFATLKAHGRAVGMPSDDDMGNSEVGHNAIGAGRVYEQGAALVQQSIASGALFEGATWRESTARCAPAGGTLHFMGLLSDGNVHSHIDHLLAMLDRAAGEGVPRVRCHVMLDGRDVPPTSALVYIDLLEARLAHINAAHPGFDYAIASGGGRLFITMDRYEADWPMVKRGWDIHVRGEGPAFPTAREAVEAFRAQRPGVIDQDLPAFVVHRNGTPVGPIRDGDAVILVNFRGDRAMEISRAFDDEDFTKFDRGAKPDVLFAGMMQYDGDLRIPRRYLVSPPAISGTMGEHLVHSGVGILAVSETQKYGHVTYFFNGNRSGKFNDALEKYVEITSDLLPFEQRPWMKAGEITDVVIEGMRSGNHKFIRVNYPNGDMVGHTGDLLAVEISVETVDLGIGRLMQTARETGAILVIAADHGNADEMYEVDKKTGKVKKDPATGTPLSKTAHTLNPVPCHFYDPEGHAGIKVVHPLGLGISSLAATCINLLGFEAPEGYDPSIIEVSRN